MRDLGIFVDELVKNKTCEYGGQVSKLVCKQETTF